MPVTPTGIIALPLYYAALTLAQSSTLQTLLGQVDATSALTKIFYGETDENAAGDERPRVLIDLIDDFARAKLDTTSWIGTGTIEALFEIPTPTLYQGESNRRDARIWFYDQVGQILADVEALAGSAGYLNVIASKITVIGRADPKDNNAQDFFVAAVDLQWQG
ncbi:MAG: hypothetical protein KGL39_26200 [Patescibacteria group bacterium]|nr:hypothetical protein [Patescibacteria group bacterium]